MDANARQFETQLRSIELKDQKESEKQEEKTGRSILYSEKDRFLITSYPDYFQRQDPMR